MVYVAWRWEGSLADEWWIDDISVKSLGTDLTIDVDVVPQLLAPGSNADLNVSLTNMTNGASGLLDLSVVFPNSNATGPQLEFEIDPIDSFGIHDITIPFAVSETVNANQRIPLQLVLTDGVEEWEHETDIQIGVPSTASVELDLTNPATVSLTLGVGDPDNPDWSVDFFTGYLETGLQTLTHDITDQFSFLPASPQSRWFVQVNSSDLVTFNGFSHRVRWQYYREQPTRL